MTRIAWFLFGSYFAVVTILAVPTLINLLSVAPEPQEELSLDAGLSDEQWKFLQDVALLIQYADDLGYKLTGGELYRTKYQQRYYVLHGLSKTYNSKHLKRLAIDLNLFINGIYTNNKEDYRILGEYWESLDEHNIWGGNWSSLNDPYHFERKL